MKQIQFYLICAVLCTVWGLRLSAQTGTVYEPLISRDPIPKEILTTSRDKYYKATSTLRTTKGASRKIQDRYYLQNSFVIDALLKSGRVIYNDDASLYVNKVANEILKKKPDLKLQLRFYIVKSPIANAFSTDRGTILVTTGLLARLETEAQLAFVLCHEIVHFLEKHSFNRYIEFETKELEDKTYRKLAKAEKILMVNNYSVVNEKTADAQGIELILETDYNFSSIPQVFDILEQADYPISTLDSTFYSSFYSAYYQNQDWNSAQTGAVTQSWASRQDFYEDDESTSSGKTHPESSKRKESVLIQLAKDNARYKSSFIVSESDFLKIRENARLAIIDDYLADGYFFDALHLTLGLLEKYPGDTYLNSCMAKSLYGVAKYHYHQKKIPLLHKYEDIQKTSFLEAFDQRSSDMMLVMALSYWATMLQQQPEIEEEANFYIKDLVMDLLEVFPNLELTGSENQGGKAAHQRLLEIQKQNQLDNVFQEAQKDKDQYERFQEMMNTYRGKNKIYQLKSKNLRKGYRMGIDQVILLDPTYYQLNVTRRAKNTLDFIASEYQQEYLHEAIKQSGEKLDLGVEIIDTKVPATLTVERHNDFTQLNRWQDEWRREDAFFFVPTNYDKVLEISKKYGTPYFAQMGFFSLKVHNPMILAGRFDPGILLFLVPSAFPLMIKSLFSSEYNSLIFMQTFDVSRNLMIMSYVDASNYKVQDATLLGHTYFLLKQIKRDPK